MNAPAVDDALRTVRRYVEAFNDGDADAMAACFTASGCILDGMAPHLWQGAEAPRDWYADVLTEGEHHGATDYLVQLGEPSHCAVTGDAAYVVMPATMTFTQRGRHIAQAGASFTAALRHDGGTWRIAAWAWTKGRALT